LFEFKVRDLKRRLKENPFCIKVEAEEKELTIVDFSQRNKKNPSSSDQSIYY
jgi:superfamily II DNA/RNA helicase